MEEDQKTNQYMTRTDYVIANLAGVTTPMEFKTAEKLCVRRLSELKQIVQGISGKWVKRKTDLEMVQQTEAEIAKISEMLKIKRAKFGPL
jgi:hypothetical protein